MLKFLKHSIFDSYFFPQLRSHPCSFLYSIFVYMNNVDVPIYSHKQNRIHSHTNTLYDYIQVSFQLPSYTFHTAACLASLRIKFNFLNRDLHEQETNIDYRILFSTSHKKLFYHLLLSVRFLLHMLHLGIILIMDFSGFCRNCRSFCTYFFPQESVHRKIFSMLQQAHDNLIEDIKNSQTFEFCISYRYGGS